MNTMTASKTVKHRNAKPYTFDFAKKKIILSKKFSKEAQIFGSSAFKLLVKLRKEYNDYDIEIRGKDSSKKCDTVTVKSLKFSDMEKHIINLYGKESKAYNAFLAQRELAKAYKNPYIVVKKWFLNNFPNWNDSKSAANHNTLTENDLKVRAAASYDAADTEPSENDSIA